MPDLGPHTVPVLLAYGFSLLFLAALVLASVLRSRQVKRALEEAEGKGDNA